MGRDTAGFCLLGYFLHLASIFYGGAVRLRVSLFDRRIFKSRKLPCMVISIGNLTLGGTGKTPMTIYTADLVQRLGYRPAVVSRGYRGRREKKGGIVSDGCNIFLTAEDAGDEAFMMARKLKNIPVLIGRDRFRSGMEAVNRFSADVIILDDGFQHLQLKRDIDLVLLDDTNPLGNGYLFPRGVLREPVSALKRADACILTRCRPGNAMPPELGPGPFFSTCHNPYLVRVIPAGSDSANDDNASGAGLELIRGHRAVAFSGIAGNDEFCRMLETMGCDVAGFAGFPDHHWYTPGDFENLMTEIRKSNADMLITTDKDYARIHGRIRWPVDLAVVGIKISLEDQADAFNAFMEKRLADFYPGNGRWDIGGVNV